MSKRSPAMARRLACVLTSIAGGLCAAITLAPAHAQTSVTAWSLSEQLFDEGRDLWQRGMVVEARRAFESAARDGHGEAARAMALSFDQEVLRQRGLPLSFANETGKQLWARLAADRGYSLETVTPATAAPVASLPVSAERAQPAPAAPVSIATAVVPAPPQAATLARLLSPPPPPTASNAVGSERTAIVDGTYSAHVMPGCNEPFQSVMLSVNAGQLAFEHVLRGIPYGWRGTVDANGAIDAVVAGSPGLTAKGRFDQNALELVYPQCAGARINMRIRWLVR